MIMHRINASCVALLALICGVWAADACAHPGSGIVVDDGGNVYFTYTSRGTAKIDINGRMTIIYNNAGGHWMCLDRAGVFANAQPKFFRRVTPDGQRPAVIYADGGAPIAVSPNGYLFYGAGHPGSEIDPGGATVARFKPGGEPELFSTVVKETLAKIDEGVTGLAIAADDTLLIASSSSVWRLKKDGSLVAIARPVPVQDCNGQLPPHGTRLQLRGLDSTPDGTVYVAAIGCGLVMKVHSDGQAEVVHKSESPWCPTGVGVRGDDLYVLEYTNANDGPDKGWRPRVRRVASNGRVITLFEAQENIPVRP